MTQPDELEEGRPFVLFELAEGVATITLNRPEHLNPMSHGPGSMHSAIVGCLMKADQDDAVGCVVITGAGRAFSAGGPVGHSTPPSSSLEWHAFLAQEDAENEKIRELRKPVIGAINGICYGAGLMMAAHFDLVIASTEARFGLIETRFGSTGAEALNYLVGPQWAKFMALTGELITAEKAREIGLVLEVVAAENLSAKAQDLGRRIAAMPRDAMLMNRRMINQGMNATGWTTQKQIGIALNTVVNACFQEHRAWNGQRFSDLLREGWKTFKDVRDAPFKDPWLDQE